MTRIVAAVLLCGLPMLARPTNASVYNHVELSAVSIHMRDGVQLVADVFLPSRSGRWPTVLVRTPYGRRGRGASSYRMFTWHGYAVVLEDVRGRNASPGVFGSIAQEGPDGSDTIDWIARQPWSNGRVGMAGGSYLGIVQWWAAVQRNPHLATIFPLVSGDDEYLDRYYSTGGAVKLGHRLSWLSENMTPRGTPRPQFGNYVYHLPIFSADRSATALALEMWRTPMLHPSYDSFWAALSISRRINRVTVPVCSMGGWFDNYCESELDAFSRLARNGRRVETWIGPWTHNFSTRFPTLDFGAAARVNVRTLQLAWFDRYLKDDAPRDTAKPGATLHIFVMNANRWREEHEWPLARTRWTPFYLASGGHANSVHGDGELRTIPAASAAADHFVYDPHDPVPSAGGALCCNPILMRPGPLDQSAVERRRDVLVYTSAPLPDDLEVTGPIRATLYVRTSANDTDFTVKLVDEGPGGRPLLVTDGIQRMRYRLSLDKPSFVKRNTAYQVQVDAGVTSWVFERGHRIRIEISSSNFPRFDRNLNSARPNALLSRLDDARQTVLHSATYPSLVVVPELPRVRYSHRASQLRHVRPSGD